MGCQAVFSPLVFDSRLFLFLRHKRGFVEKRVTFEASDFMVYWSLPCTLLDGEWCICTEGKF